MQEFIQSAVSQLGINEDQASPRLEAAQFSKDSRRGNEAQTLIAKLPGAEDVIRSPGASSESSGNFGRRRHAWGIDFDYGTKRRCFGCLTG